MIHSETCAYEGCKYTTWEESENGLCLCHDPNNGRDAETAKRVWEEAWRKCDVGDCTFRGWHFPANEKGFAGRRLLEQADFRNTIFSGEVTFEKAKFGGGAEFYGAKFDADVSFGGAEFGGLALFDRTKFGAGVSFGCAEFYVAGFAGAEFEGAATFIDAEFGGGALFRGARFGDAAWFGFAKFGEDATFDAAEFVGAAYFGRAKVDGGASFVGAKFDSNATFFRAEFGGEANFLGAEFGEEASFREATIREGSQLTVDTPSWDLPFVRPQPFRERQHGIGCYRLAKQAALKAGNYGASGEYHYAEQCAISWERRRNGIVGWMRAFARDLLFRIVFGYGERPLQPLAIGMVTIALFAGIFWYGAGISPDGELGYIPTVWEALYFSLVSFTTFGYGDFQPKPGMMRVFTGLETGLGGALMAVFIVCLTRKYMR